MKKKSDIDRAEELTKDIFKNIDVKQYEYKGYELIWSLYNTVNTKYSIPYIQNRGQNSFVKKRPKNSKVYMLKLIIQDIILVLYSMSSILLLKSKKLDNIVAIWTGDFYDERTKSDFRLGNLYNELEKENISFVEFVRDDTNGFVHCIKNMIKRKRLTIYYSSVERIFTLYKLKKHKVYLKEKNELHFTILKNLMRSVPDIKKINIFSFIFRFLKVKKFLCWEYSDRQAQLIYASKISNIKTIGFMHGAGMKNYMVHEFITEFNSDKKIGPDIMGVWSEWWEKYYNKNSKLYGQVEVSGTLKKEDIKVNKNIKQSTTETILWISEPLVEVSDVIEYLKYFKKNYKLKIKKRPSTNDIFYNNLISVYPEFKDIYTYDGDISEAAMQCDFVVGSHSTAVIEVSKIGIPCLLVYTKKWGNYFEVKDDMYIKSIDDIDDKIIKAYSQDTSEIKENFFGKDEDKGVNWIIEKVKND